MEHTRNEKREIKYFLNQKEITISHFSYSKNILNVDETIILDSDSIRKAYYISFNELFELTQSPHIKNSLFDICSAKFYLLDR